MAILQQDWEETTDCMDMTTNIQNILDGLSNEEPMDESSEQTAEKTEEKENLAEGSSTKKLFPLFYKGEAKPQPPM